MFRATDTDVYYALVRTAHATILVPWLLFRFCTTAPAEPPPPPLFPCALPAAEMCSSSLAAPRRVADVLLLDALHQTVAFPTPSTVVNTCPLASFPLAFC